MVDAKDKHIIDRLQQLGRTAETQTSARQLRINLPSRAVFLVGVVCFCVGAGATLMLTRAIQPETGLSDAAKNFVVQEVAENRGVTPSVAKAILKSVATELVN